MKYIVMLLCWATLLYADVNPRAIALVEHVRRSIEEASQNRSPLLSHPDALNVSGRTGIKVRSLLNNLCSYPHTRYLEIGLLRGATFIAALYNNSSSIEHAVGIDNWSYLNEPENRATFFKNIECFLQPYLNQQTLTILESDCWSIPLSNFPAQPVNIYFYDGDHSRAAQSKALSYYDRILDDVFIYVVDDWSFSTVRKGILDSLQSGNYIVHFSRALHCKPSDQNSWWNGIFIAVLEKPHPVTQ